MYWKKISSALGSVGLFLARGTRDIPLRRGGGRLALFQEALSHCVFAVAEAGEE